MSTSAFKIIPRFDDALDLVAMGEVGFAKYRDTMDFSTVVLKDGFEPTVYHCRRLRVSEMQAVRSRTSTDDAYAAAFARGVEKVEGLRDLDDETKRRIWVRPSEERPISVREIDEVFSAGEVFEVGSAIFGRSILGKGRPAAWPQPATLRHAVGALVVRLAEQTRAQDAASPPSNPPAAGAPPETTGP